MRNRVKAPLQGAGSRAVGADVARRRGKPFGDAPADDHQILVDHARRREAHVLLRRISSEIAAKIDSTAVAERGDRFPRRRVERIEILIDGGEHAFVAAVAPIHHGAIRSLTLDARVERPQQRARVGTQRKRLVRRRIAVQHPVGDDRLRLQPAALAAVVGPGDLQVLDVALVDLPERRVADLIRRAAVRRPAGVPAGRLHLLPGGVRGRQRCCCDERERDYGCACHRPS
jgi:hypothetical protein